MKRITFTITTIDDWQLAGIKEEEASVGMYPIAYSYDINNIVQEEVDAFKKIAIKEFRTKKIGRKPFEDKTYEEVLITPATVAVIMTNTYSVGYPELLYTRYTGWTDIDE